MALSAITPDITKLWHGAGSEFEVLWDNNSLGLLHGTVEESVTYGSSAVGDSTQFGITPITFHYNGIDAKVTVNLREATYATWVEFMEGTQASDYIKLDERATTPTGAPLVIRGYQQYSKATAVDDESFGTGDGSKTRFPDSGYTSFANDRVKRGTIVIEDGVENFSDNGDGTLTGDGGGSGECKYANAAAYVTFAVAVVNLTAINLDYTYYAIQNKKHTYYNTVLSEIGSQTHASDGALVRPFTFQVLLDTTRSAGDRLGEWKTEDG